MFTDHPQMGGSACRGMCWDSTTELEENVAKLDDVRQQIKAVERMLALPETKNKSHLSESFCKNDLAGSYYKGRCTRVGCPTYIDRQHGEQHPTRTRSGPLRRRTRTKGRGRRTAFQGVGGAFRAGEGRSTHKSLRAWLQPVIPFTLTMSASSPIAELHDDAVTTKETKDRGGDTPHCSQPPGRREEFVELCMTLFKESMWDVCVQSCVLQSWEAQGAPTRAPAVTSASLAIASGSISTLYWWPPRHALGTEPQPLPAGAHVRPRCACRGSPFLFSVAVVVWRLWRQYRRCPTERPKRRC